MKLLATINPENITEEEVKKFNIRYAARAVVFDAGGNVALLNVQKYRYHKIPGGGIEASEDVPTALQRECMEEIGCKVEIGSEIGEIVEYRGQFKLKQISYCYRAKVVGGKGVTSFTESEKSNDFKVEWAKLDDAIKTFEVDNPDEYEGNFIRERDLTFLRNY
ncbi:MAG: NUDIX domain-containing protein [Candidatus Veblenbacteria bacterium]|nr:NUDIX domain-containing protein [Candidatus Veblenbacteria bacterium]